MRAALILIACVALGACGSPTPERMKKIAENKDAMLMEDANTGCFWTMAMTGPATPVMVDGKQAGCRHTSNGRMHDADH